MSALPEVSEPDAAALARLLRYQWRRRSRRPSTHLRVATALAARARSARRRELVAAALRVCGLLGATALLRAEVDADGDVVVRGLDGMPLALLRVEAGSLVRLF
jgi:hypothetical protein